jgi:hypothetical protein
MEMRVVCMKKLLEFIKELTEDLRSLFGPRLKPIPIPVKEEERTRK